MKLFISTRNVKLSPHQQTQVKDRVQFVLGRLLPLISRVSIQIETVNGLRGGNSKRCQIISEMDAAENIVTDATSETIYQAISLAAKRAKRRVQHQNELQNQKPRLAHCHL